MIAAAAIGPAFSQSVDDTLATVLSRAYSMLRVSPPDAEKLFEEAARRDPSNVAVRKQLGYLYHESGRTDLAVSAFQAADSLAPSDTTKLQLAYWLRQANRGGEAEGYFRKVVASPDPELRNAAQAELDAGIPSGPPPVWWTRIYAAPFYDTRWETTFYQAFFQEGYALTDDRILSGYGFVSYSGDSRSSGGRAPSIYSDNAVIVGLGLKAAPFTGFQASIQQGLAVDVVTRGDRATTRGDFRAAAVYGNGLYAPYSYHPDWRAPLAPFADVYSSVGYYSRYDNVIGYLDGRAGIRLFEAAKTVGDIFAKAGLVRDSQKEYYNNVVEWGAGARVTPDINWGLYLQLEVKRGWYWDTGGPLPPYDPYYTSWRFFVIYDRTF